jgi:hypothetical protein
VNENPRKRLGDLLSEGFKGRSLRGAWRDLNHRLTGHHALEVSWEAFRQWCAGLAFPSTRLRQDTLGDVVGGDIGKAIRCLSAPAFRNFAYGLMKGRQMGTHSLRKKKQPRDFPGVGIRDGAGHTVRKAVIVCVTCGERAYHLRRGAMESEDFFTKDGWLVGSSAKGDKCPECKKVIHMKEHKKDAVQAVQEVVEETPRTQTGTERAVIAMKIAENFDEKEARYQSGWSDIKIAGELDLPLDWVHAEREHLYPGSIGDNPDTVEFISSLTLLKEGQSAFDKRVDKLSSTVADNDGLLRRLEDAQREARQESARVVEDRDKFRHELNRLNEIAENFPRPFQARASEGR